MCAARTHLRIDGVGVRRGYWARKRELHTKKKLQVLGFLPLDVLPARGSRRGITIKIRKNNNN